LDSSTNQGLRKETIKIKTLTSTQIMLDVLPSLHLGKQRIASLTAKSLEIPQRPTVCGQDLQHLTAGHGGQGFFWLAR